MIRSILGFSVANRYAVILVTLIATAFGAWSLARLPIDAVPDVTNNQVQVNAIAPALTPVEIEKQVTVLVERALAGTPGLESLRSFSRSEEHTSELQSRPHLVCRLLLEKKNVQER